jgi:hypothetical protein
MAMNPEPTEPAAGIAWRGDRCGDPVEQLAQRLLA